LKPPISIKPTATGSGGYPPEGRKSWGFISPPEPPLVPPYNKISRFDSVATNLD
jgi:hypothetical protein